MNDNNTKQKIILISILSALGVYLSGLATQFLFPELRQKAQTDTWGYPETVPISFHPIKCLSYALTTSKGLMVIGAIFISIVAVIGWIYLSKDGQDRVDDRGFVRSRNGTYGTSKWLSDAEIREILDWKSIKETDGTILGTKNGKVISSPVKSRMNKHIAIYGASGTGKSRCFARGHIIQCAKRNESVIVTDPKGELYEDMSEYLRQQGYDVKVFNLVETRYSDAWNILGELTKNPGNEEMMAQTFTEIVISNTDKGGGDHFWSESEGNLLKALALYVALDEYRPPETRTIGAMYEIAISSDEKKLNAIFDKLPASHPARMPYSIFRNNSDTVKANTIGGLGVRLQVFQNKVIRDITGHDEIDMEGPAKRKSAFFVIMSDQESTLDFLATLFFSFLFIRLVRYADVYGKDKKCDVPVNFILDEFPNIGQIPDFTKKLSTIRSRDLRVAVIFQNIAQLQNRYPDGLWEEIIGNCDTQLFLGCTDATTAKFISERTGTVTVEVKSTSLQKQAITPTQDYSQYKETESEGKRALLTPDEVMKIDNSKAMVILRGKDVFLVDKFDYANHPESKYLTTTLIREHIPQWRRDEDEKRVAKEDKAEQRESTVKEVVPVQPERTKTEPTKPVEIKTLPVPTASIEVPMPKKEPSRVEIKPPESRKEPMNPGQKPRREIKVAADASLMSALLDSVDEKDKKMKRQEPSESEDHTKPSSVKSVNIQDMLNPGVVPKKKTED